MNRNKSRSLIVLACLFLASGVGGVARGGIAAYRGLPGAGLSYFDLAYILIGLGLFRLDPLGRRGALVALWLVVVTTCAPLAYLVHPPWMESMSLYGTPMLQIPRTYLFAYVVVSFTVAAWALRLLFRPDVRGLFAPRNSF